MADMQILVKIDGEVDSDDPLAVLIYLLSDVQQQLRTIKIKYGLEFEKAYPIRCEVDYAASRLTATVDLRRD